MVTKGSTITFRQLSRDDFAVLSRWLATPDVRRWWNHDVGRDDIERDFGASVDGDEAGEDLVVSADGVPIGLVQRARIVDYPDDLAEFEPIIGAVPATAFSIDYLLGETELLGRGIGPAVIRAVSDDTFARFADADRILVPVVAANRRSWRALEKAGYRIIASGAMTPDNPIDDAAHHILRLDRPT